MARIAGQNNACGFCCQDNLAYGTFTRSLSTVMLLRQSCLRNFFKIIVYSYFSNMYSSLGVQCTGMVLATSWHYRAYTLYSLNGIMIGILNSSGICWLCFVRTNTPNSQKRGKTNVPNLGQTCISQDLEVSR